MRAGKAREVRSIETAEPSTFVIAGLVPAIHLASAWTTGTSPVVATAEGLGSKKIRLAG